MPKQVAYYLGVFAAGLILGSLATDIFNEQMQRRPVIAQATKSDSPPSPAPQNIPPDAPASAPLQYTEADVTECAYRYLAGTNNLMLPNGDAMTREKIALWAHSTAWGDGGLDSITPEKFQDICIHTASVARQAVQGMDKAFGGN